MYRPTDCNMRTMRGQMRAHLGTHVLECIEGGSETVSVCAISTCAPCVHHVTQWRFSRSAVLCMGVREQWFVVENLTPSHSFLMPPLLGLLPNQLPYHLPFQMPCQTLLLAVRRRGLDRSLLLHRVWMTMPTNQHWSDCRKTSRLLGPQLRLLCAKA